MLAPPYALKRALEEIRDIASGSTTANSLPHIARIAEDALDWKPPAPTLHRFEPHPKHPWFCKECGYAPCEPLKHIQEQPA